MSNNQNKPTNISIDKIIEDTIETQDKLAELQLKQPKAKLKALLEQIKEQDDSQSILEQIRARQEDYDDEDECVSEEEFDEDTEVLYNSHCLYQELQDMINQEQNIESVRQIVLNYMTVICTVMPDVIAQRVKYCLEHK